MIKIRPPIRGEDSHGSGYYGAPRGDHKHRGLDFVALRGVGVESVSDGTVTKLGYCYNDDLSYRYVEITSAGGYVSRYLYVEPGVDLGVGVKRGDLIGEVQDIAKRYPGIIPHFHFEVRLKGAVIPPAQYFKRLEA